MINWPATLPTLPEQSMFKIKQRYTPPLVTDMDSGTQRRRKVSTVAVAILGYGFLCYEDVLAIFDSFVVNDLIDGTQEFLMPVWKPGAGLVSRVCAIDKGIWEGDVVEGELYSVTFDLRVRGW